MSSSRDMPTPLSVDREQAFFLVEGDGDERRAGLFGEACVGKRFVAQLLAGVGRVGDELAQEDVALRIDGMRHELHSCATSAVKPWLEAGAASRVAEFGVVGHVLGLRRNSGSMGAPRGDLAAARAQPRKGATGDIGGRGREVASASRKGRRHGGLRPGRGEKALLRPARRKAIRPATPAGVGAGNRQVGV